MKKINVYLQYPWKIADSQYYKSIIDNPPENIVYRNVRKNEGMILSKKNMRFFNFMKRQVRNWMERLKLVIPNTRFTKTSEKYDLIHCAHCLSKNETPWVADFEGWWQMWVSGRENKKGNKKILEILKKEHCKKIIAWTPEVKEDIVKRFPEIKDKIDIITFALPLKKIKYKTKKKKTILFVARYFFWKGGLHALEAFDRITKNRKDIDAIVVSDVPQKIKEKYKNNKHIKIYDLMPHSKIMEEIFPLADVFVYPGYSDTFGFVFVEALSLGIPVVTVDGFSRKYIIEEGKTGFVIDKPKNFSVVDKPKNFKLDRVGKNEQKVIESLVEKTTLLLKDKKMRERMSKNCIEEVKNGKFSIKERNKRLRKVYEEALK